MLRKIKPYSKYVLMAIEQIKQHIDGNPFQCKTCSQVIESFTTPNRSTLEKAFRDLHGAGIKEYQVSRRLEASKGLLEQGMTKKQVASKCFYSSQSSFAAAFKKEFNMTPTEWQLLYG